MNDKMMPNVRFKGFTDAWEQRKLEELSLRITVGIATSSTNAFTNDSSGVPLIKNQNIKNGKISTAGLEHITREFDEKNRTKRVKSNDVITARTGYPGLSAVVPASLDNAQTFTTLITRLNTKLILPEFFVQYINSEVGTTQILKMQAGGAQQNVNAGFLKKFKLCFPKYREQEQLVYFFDELDQTIAHHQKKLENLQQLKKLFLQKIFDQEWRFKGFTDPWEQRKLGTMLREHIELVVGSKYPIATSSRQGLFLQNEYFEGKRAEIDENVSFHLVPQNFVTYRHMSDDSIFHFNKNTLGTPVEVSREYPVFTTDNTTNIDFIVQHLNSSPHFLYFSEIQKKGGTRTRLYYKVLSQYKLMIPSHQEQDKIVELLRVIDSVIAHHQKKLNQLKQLKKWLLQNMFV